MRGLPFLALLALLARVSPSRAEEEEGLPLDLEWSAPEGCASAEQIRAELGRIARVRPGRSISRLSARGRIEKTGDAYRLTLRTERNGQAGERSLSAKECRSLEREVTLVLAVAFGEGVELVEENAGAGENGQTTPARPEDAHPPAAAAAAASGKASGKTTESPETAKTKPSTHPEAGGQRPLSRRQAGLKPRFSAFLGGGVQFETLPSPAALVVAGAELGWRAFWFEPRFVWLPHVGETLERGVQASYDGIGGALAACHVLPPVSWSLNACLGWEATALRARSSGATESGEAVAPLYAGVFSLAWEWPTLARGALSLRLEAALHVAFNEPRFVVEGLGQVHQVPLLAPSLAAMVAFFPGR